MKALLVAESKCVCSGGGVVGGGGGGRQKDVTILYINDKYDEKLKVCVFMKSQYNPNQVSHYPTVKSDCICVHV